MPKLPGRFCKVWGCGEIVRGGSYCEEHLAERRRAYDKRRGSASERGYGATWQKVRRAKLRQTPICEDPFNLHPGAVVSGGVVDHIIPLAQGGTHVLDNLQTLCPACHNHKTATHDGGFGNPVSVEGRGDQIPGRYLGQNRAGGFRDSPAKLEWE